MGEPIEIGGKMYETRHGQLAEKPPDCPVCDSPGMRPSVHYLDVLAKARDWHGPKIRVDGLENFLCDKCGADPVYPDQIRRNEKRIADARASYQEEVGRE